MKVQRLPAAIRVHKSESTVRYLGIEVEDALEILLSIEI